MTRPNASTEFEICVHLAETARGSVEFLLAPIELAKSSKTEAPDYIQIFPAGPVLQTEDGRSFKMSDPQAFVDQTMASAKPILVDYDHLSHFDTDEGGSSKAAGWIQKLEVRDGEVWAKVEWTVTASEAIANREYRFVSPEFTTHKKTDEVVGLIAVGLVNRPAFEMAALARSKTNPSGENSMFTEIAKALGLKSDATDEQIVEAINKTNSDHATELAAAEKKSAPSLEKFVPRDDYNTVLARAEKAEKDIEDAKVAVRESDVEAMIAAAIKGGKIAPASKDHYVQLAATEEGFETVKELVESLPPVIENPETEAVADDPDDGDDAANLATKAKTYQAEQARNGITVSIADAVNHVKGDT